MTDIDRLSAPYSTTFRVSQSIYLSTNSTRYLILYDVIFIPGHLANLP